MIRIFADFNNVDLKGRVRLNTAGSLRDMAEHKSELREGLEVILYTSDEFEVRGTLVYDLGMWKGVPRMETILYYDEEDPSGRSPR